MYYYYIGYGFSFLFNEKSVSGYSRDNEIHADDAAGRPPFASLREDGRRRLLTKCGGDAERSTARPRGRVPAWCDRITRVRRAAVLTATPSDESYSTFKFIFTFKKF